MVSDEQSLLRQQIVFSRYLAEDARRAKSRVRRDAYVQASIKSLELGLLSYTRGLFDDPDLSCLSALRGRATDTGGDYRCEEILTLVEREDSWLHQIVLLAKSFHSLTSMPKVSTQIIASSRPTEHWSAIPDQELDLLILNATEMLDRHSAHDQEY